HRADVCPTLGNPICCRCGILNPDKSHQCTPKYKLSGGEHSTANEDCKQRFEIPYIVRRRLWDRARAAEEMETNEDQSTEQSLKPPPNTAQNQSLRSPRSTSRSLPGSKGRSKSPLKPQIQFPRTEPIRKR
ncbi:hypothetical protein MTO96_041077, partial [Rhipicephalus appendiculatus]